MRFRCEGQGRMVSHCLSSGLQEKGKGKGKSKGKGSFNGHGHSTGSKGRGQCKGVYSVWEQGWESSADHGWESSDWYTQEWTQPAGGLPPSSSSAASTSVGPSVLTALATVQGVPFQRNYLHVLSVSLQVLSVGAPRWIRYLTHGDISLMFDAGPRFGIDNDAGQRVLLPVLQQVNERLDVLVLSNLL